MEIAKQLSVFLANKPGMLAEVCNELADAEINIYALTISDTADHSVVRMVVSNHEKALRSIVAHQIRSWRCFFRIFSLQISRYDCVLFVSNIKRFFIFR